MKSAALSVIIIALGLLPAAATALDSDDLTLAIARRALPNAPDGYTPTNVSCPASRPTVRSAARLSPNETSWLNARHRKTLSAMKDFFGHVPVGNFDVASYLDRISSGNSPNLPTIGIALSGGGYRALMNGAGAIKAFDSREVNASASGHLGGLLQSATYVSGLSGGSWLVGSIYINNFTTISDLQTHKSGAVWEFGNSIFEGPNTGGIQLLSSGTYYTQLANAVDAKDMAGFNTSITDIWGRALSYQMFNASKGGISYTWSSIGLTPDFQDANYPMPLVVADGRNPGMLIVNNNSTIYEFNPWELGTWDPTIYGFVPLEYLGSRFVNGLLPSNERCVRGFDNAGFIIGTSSSLFNEFLIHLKSTNLPGFVKAILHGILKKFGKTDQDIAVYDPNPFYGYNPSISPYAQQPELFLVDGGEDLQNIPLQPLIQPQRHVDVVFAVDSGDDTRSKWPNGSSLVATYERSLKRNGIANGTAFPTIPDQNTIVNLGLNSRPTFFGCNASNLTGPAPLIVYLPNHPYSTFSNTSTFQLSYSNTERDNIILNGYEVVTMANSTLDGNWSTCVGCAILSRSFERTNTPVPDICSDCFQRYCWNGTLNTTRPAPYEPTLVLSGAAGSGGSSGNGKSAATALVPTMLSAIVATTAAIFFLV